MYFLSKTKALVACIFLFIVTFIKTSAAPDQLTHQSVLIMQKNDLLGVKLSLSASSQKPISNVHSTEILTDKILKDPGVLLTEIDKVKDEQTKSEEDLTNNYPFRLFDACLCMPQNPVYTSFSKEAISRAVDLYKQRDPQKPFVYGSFASGGLFPDLYILTSFVSQLRSQGIKDIYIQVNLIDTDLRDYIFKHSRGLSKSSLPGTPVHSHMLSYKPTSQIGFSNASDVTDLIVNFLQWFTQNLKIKLDLYIYGTGQDYVYDNEKKRVPSHDMLMAIDYWEEAEGDLAQLALRTIKIGGLLCSLDNKAPEEIETHKKEIETHKGPVPSTYKELAELVKKEDVNDLLDKIAQKSNSISEIRSSIIEEYKKVPHSAKLDSLIKERETISTQLDPLEKEAQIYESKKHELYDEIMTILKSILELVEKGYDEDKYNILRQQQEKKEQERNTNDKALEKVLEKRLAMMQKDNEIGEEIKKEETGIQSPNIASLKQQIDTLQKEVDQLNADVDAINKKNKTNLEAFPKEGEERTAYTVISEKTADISATAFKDLMKKARGDNRKIGILFCPLFYPLDLHLYPQLKQRMSQSEKAKETLKFNPFSYFKVTYKLGQKYKTFFD